MQNLRFLQIHNLYPVYYTYLYAKIPHLADAPYEVQNTVLIDDGFAGIHMFAPYLGEHGYETQLVFANCSQAQQRWGAENGLRISGRDWEQDILRHQIERFQPDILYLSDPISFDSRFIRSLPRRPRLILGWRAANIPAHTDWSEFDVILSALPNLLRMAKSLGARSTELFSPGVPARFPQRFAGQERTTDVSFAGQMNATQYKRRNALLEALASSAAKSRFTLDLHLILPNGFQTIQAIEAYRRPPAFGTDLYKALSRTKIAFDARGSIELQNHPSNRSRTSLDLAETTTANMRIFEATACGALLLTEEQSNLHQYFEPGTEIVTYRDESDLIKSIEYFLSNDDERQAIAERGRQRCLRDHSMAAKAKRLDTIIRNYLETVATKREGSSRQPAITNGNHIEQPVFSGTLSEALVRLEHLAKTYPRRKPGRLVIENQILDFADLHSVYHELKQIFAHNIYGFSTDNKEPIILDCGAHVGLATMYFARRYPYSQIHSFEADPKIFRLLQSNIANAGLNNVVAYGQAVWTHDKGVGFRLSGDDSGCVDQTEAEAVPSVRLKSFLENFSHIDLLKLDVEGAEFAILEDCNTTLSRISNIIIEVHHLSNIQPKLSKIFQALEESNFHYTISDLHEAKWTKNDNPTSFDYINNNKFILTVFASRIFKNNNTDRNNKKTIAQFCMQDFGGAGTAALRLHESLLKCGENDIFFVQNIAKWKKNTSSLTAKSYQNHCEKLISPEWKLFLEKNKSALAKYPKRPKGMEMFTIPWSPTQIKDISELSEIELVNLHWISGTLDISRNIEILKDKKIIWTLHDMNPFTGGCHYAGECKSYKASCGRCPQLGSDHPIDLSNNTWEIKNNAYQQLDITVIAPSKWIAKCAKESSLLNKFPIHVIPNGIPTDIFKPYSQEKIREHLDISQHSFVIAFGADSVINVRKGFSFLLSALEELQKYIPKQDVVLAVFGNEASDSLKNCGFQTIFFNYVSEESELAMVYSMADVTVVPSLEDNLPNIVLESLSCGTPVAAFHVGGIPDMVQHQVNGYLAPSRDHVKLAHGIKWIKDQKDEGSDIRSRCREIALRKYDQSLQAKQYLNIYRNIITKQK